MRLCPQEWPLASASYSSMMVTVGPGLEPLNSARNAVLATPPGMRSEGTGRSPLTLKPSASSSFLSSADDLNSCWPSSL